MSSTSEPPATAAKQAVSPTAGNSPLHPAAVVAQRFMQGVVAGDADLTMAQLTPRAIEQFQQHGKGFSLPGMEQATFRIGQVRQLSDEEVVVQCLLCDPSAGEPQQEESLYCGLRWEPVGWRIRGIACDVGPNQPPVTQDFENLGPSRPAPLQHTVETTPPSQPSRTAGRGALPPRR